MDKCQLCEADTGRHPAGTVIRREPCGCDVAGIGLLPNPWHTHQCSLHATAGALLEALEEMVEEAPSAEVYDMRAAVAKARAAIAQAKSVT